MHFVLVGVVGAAPPEGDVSDFARWVYLVLATLCRLISCGSKSGAFHESARKQKLCKLGCASQPIKCDEFGFAEGTCSEADEFAKLAAPGLQDDALQ